MADNVVGKDIVVWFSCGMASAVAAKLTVDVYGKHNNVTIVNTPIAEEDDDNRRFADDVSKWIGKEIHFEVNHKFPLSSIVDVFDRKKYMGGIKGAPCTQLLKKEARYQYTSRVNVDFHVLGFTSDERRRHDKFVLTEISNVIPVLIEFGVTKTMCKHIIAQAGIDRPRMYDLGYPNANCPGCIKSTSPAYWNLVRKTHPEVFESRATQSRRIGAKLVRVSGERVFLDELSREDDSGVIDESVECGIFCEERW